MAAARAKATTPVLRKPGLMKLARIGTSHVDAGRMGLRAAKVFAAT
jgi:hypothetical protein